MTQTYTPQPEPSAETVEWAKTWLKQMIRQDMQLQDNPDRVLVALYAYSVLDRKAEMRAPYRGEPVTDNPRLVALSRYWMNSPSNIMGGAFFLSLREHSGVVYTNSRDGSLGLGRFAEYLIYQTAAMFMGFLKHMYEHTATQANMAKLYSDLGLFEPSRRGVQKADIADELRLVQRLESLTDEIWNMPRDIHPHTVPRWFATARRVVEAAMDLRLYLEKTYGFWPEL